MINFVELDSLKSRSKGDRFWIQRFWIQAQLIVDMKRGKTKQPNSSDTRPYVLVGKTGVGKSQLANLLAGKNKLQVRGQEKSTSCTAGCQKVRSDDGKLFIDFVGLMDTNWPVQNKDTYRQLKQCLRDRFDITLFINLQIIIKAIHYLEKRAPDGVCGAILVLRRGVFSEEEQVVIELILDLLPEDAEVWKRVVVVVTHCEDLNAASQQEVLDDLTKNHPLIARLFQRIENRACCIGYNPHPPQQSPRLSGLDFITEIMLDRKEQAEQMIKALHTLLDKLPPGLLKDPLQRAKVEQEQHAVLSRGNSDSFHELGDLMDEAARHGLEVPNKQACCSVM